MNAYPFGYALIVPAVLLVAFVALKLAGEIDWSWWRVLSPVWAAAAMAVVGGVVTLVVFRRRWS